MIAPPSAAHAADPRPAMSGAEERFEMLRRLAVLGMRLTEEVCERAINSPYHPEPVHEPARAFATVSRAVRLTIVLQAKAEADWFAFRDGGALPKSTPCGARPMGGGKAVSRDATSTEDRDDTALETLDRAGESLHEYERFDEILSRPFDDCVAAVRADLGLEPGADIPSDDLAAPAPSNGANGVRDPDLSVVTRSTNSVSARHFGGVDPPDTG